MTTSPQIANTLVSIGSLAGLWVLFHWVYRDYRKDLLQNRLFALREELFEAARLGRFDFQHPAYGVLRSTINGFIGTGFRISLVGVITFAVSFRNEDIAGKETYLTRLSRLSTDLPDQERRELRKLLDRLNWCVLDHIIFTSLPLAILAWPFRGGVYLARGLRLPEIVSWLKQVCSPARWTRRVFELACSLQLVCSPLSLAIVDRMDNAALAFGGSSVTISPAYAAPAQATTAGTPQQRVAGR